MKISKAEIVEISSHFYEFEIFLIQLNYDRTSCAESTQSEFRTIRPSSDLVQPLTFEILYFR